MGRINLKTGVAVLGIYVVGVLSGVMVGQRLGGGSGRIRVVVVGEVEKPGAYVLARGSLLKDLVHRAGGFTAYADLSEVNLGAVLEEGMTVMIPARRTEGGAEPTNEPAGLGNTGSGGAGDGKAEAWASAGAADKEEETRSTSPERVNINTATARELEKLPGIGPKLAEEIIKFRETYGPFKSKEDLKKVKGIGEAKFARIADQITV
ncbi:MAG: helix-hairpin-helix domain-containing protein [bacterium JZ-2024 1]